MRNEERTERKSHEELPSISKRVIYGVDIKRKELQKELHGSSKSLRRRKYRGSYMKKEGLNRPPVQCGAGMSVVRDEAWQGKRVGAE